MGWFAAFDQIAGREEGPERRELGRALIKKEDPKGF
jgi:hypothetical protein